MLPLIKVLRVSKCQACIFWADIYILVFLVSKQFATFLHISLSILHSSKTNGKMLCLLSHLLARDQPLLFLSFRDTSPGTTFFLSNRLIETVKTSNLLVPTFKSAHRKVNFWTEIDCFPARIQWFIGTMWPTEGGIFSLAHIHYNVCCVRYLILGTSLNMWRLMYTDMYFAVNSQKLRRVLFM